MPVARVLSTVADPLQLAAAVSDLPGLLVLWDATGVGRSYVAAEPVEVRTGLDPEPTLALTAETNELFTAPRWFGVLPYEAQRSLERSGRVPTERREAPHFVEPLWFRYPAVAEIQGGRVRVIGDDAASVARLSRALGRSARIEPGALCPRSAHEPAERHQARIEAALELIARGEIYQVNLARRFAFGVEGSWLGLLARQVRQTRARYGALFVDGPRALVSTSPELFLRVAQRRLLTAPIKGTRPRGGDALQDRAFIAELQADPKEHAELSMVVDIERNDFGRVCVPGSVRVSGAYRTETHPTLHHRVAHVQGLLRPATSRAEVLAATLPSGSVTGAPKIRAMEVIASLEAERRGLYTGAFGVLRHDGGLELAIAIRTLTGLGQEAHYFAGGGIVADSNPAREVEETLWKAAQVGLSA